MEQSDNLLKRMPLKRGLDLTILAMGIFTLVLILVTGELYRRLAVDSQAQTLTSVIEIEATQLRATLSEQAQLLGMDIQRDPELRQALTMNDPDAIDAALQQQFHRYFVTAGVLDLVALVLLDEHLDTLGIARSEKLHASSSPLCDATIAGLRARSGYQRLQPLSASCLVNGRAVQTETVAIGLKPAGYVVVVTNPVYNLLPLENHLDTPITLSAPGGYRYYRSDNWQTDINPRAHVETAVQLSGTLGEPLLQVNAQGNFVEFYENLVSLQQWILGLAVAATLLTMFVARSVTGRLVLEPLKYLSSQLRRAGAGRRLMDKQHNVMAVHEFAELQELYSALQTMALTDPLTHLPNRLHFERLLENLVEQAHQRNEHHVLCCLDLDNFKIVNDSCGHAAGDLLLQQLSGIFQEQIRDVDTIARIGGDEFALILEHCSVNDATRIANELRKAVSDYRFFWHGQCFSVGTSIGLVPVNARSGSATRVMSLADASCYVAKQQGRNRVHHYQESEAALQQADQGMQLAARLQQALKDDLFELFCQPVLPCSRRQTGVEFYELLVYLNDGEKRLRPAKFMQAAERYNLTTPIDRWVLRTALNWLTQQNEAGHHTRLSINLSGSSLADDAYLNEAVQLIHDSGIEGEQLAFEITESGSSHNFSKTMRFISTLKGLGCKFILDDFGTGMSSFTYLQNLTLDYIKIDGRFINRSLRGNDQRVLDAISQIGRALHIPTIAECVESELLLGRLRQIGIDYCQGYHFGDPQPLDTLVTAGENRLPLSDSQ